MSIKDVIARCIARMRSGACVTCDNRACPAGHWQRLAAEFAPRRTSTSGGWLGLILGAIGAAAAPAAPCLRARVEAEIEAALATGPVGIDQVAARLGISRQTLYRRLRSEGATFDAVLAAKRRQLAIRYLGVERLPVKVAAYRLGFSDPAAFSRAFKRWTGSSPSSFRAA